MIVKRLLYYILIFESLAIQPALFQPSVRPHRARAEPLLLLSPSPRTPYSLLASEGATYLASLLWP